MKTNYLNLGVQEMNVEEMRNVEGGLPILIPLALVIAGLLVSQDAY